MKTIVSHKLSEFKDAGKLSGRPQMQPRDPRDRAVLHQMFGGFGPSKSRSQSHGMFPRFLLKLACYKRDARNEIPGKIGQNGLLGHSHSRNLISPQRSPLDYEDLRDHCAKDAQKKSKLTFPLCSLGLGIFLHIQSKPWSPMSCTRCQIPSPFCAFSGM